LWAINEDLQEIGYNHYLLLTRNKAIPRSRYLRQFCQQKI
jgi:hypothetical protein